VCKNENNGKMREVGGGEKWIKDVCGDEWSLF
jgi:hypothetical protein